MQYTKKYFIGLSSLISVFHLYDLDELLFLKKYLFLKHGMSWLCVKRICKWQITSSNSHFDGNF